MPSRPLSLSAALLALSGCALWQRPGPRPDAPTESALTSAPPPDLCKVSPSALRRIGPVEAGTTPFGKVLELLGLPPLAPAKDRGCWLTSSNRGYALFAHGGGADLPVRSLALAEPDPDSARACRTTSALPEPLAFEAGLRPGLSRDDVEKVLGPLTVDEGGAFGKECCGLEQTGVGEKGPVYGFGCSAVLGTFREGSLASVLVSRYAPPATGEAER